MVTSTSAPFSIRSLATSNCPPSAASISAVQPSAMVTSTSAPFSIRSLATSNCPFSAARIRPVQCLAVVPLTLPPCASLRRTNSSSPPEQATKKAWSRKNSSEYASPVSSFTKGIGSCRHIAHCREPTGWEIKDPAIHHRS